MRELGSPWLVIGGIAVVGRGFPRTTADIDLTLSGRGVEMAHLLALFQRNGIEPRIKGAAEFARKNNVLLLEHTESGIPIDLSLAWLPFEEEAIARAEFIDFAGTPIPIATVDDLIVYKIVAFRPKDIEDIEQLADLHFGRIDVERIVRLTAEFAELLGDKERIALVRRLFPTRTTGSKSPPKRKPGNSARIAKPKRRTPIPGRKPR